MDAEIITAGTQTIYIVDDDPAVRDALGVVFRMEDFDVVGFENGDDFLAAARNTPPSCVILDIHMPGRSGMEILKEVDATNYPSPIFIISGRGDIPTAVSAIKLGAFDFIEKPFDADTVVTRVSDALQKSVNPKADSPYSFDGVVFESLTPRERDVLMQITSGASNKEAGRNLGISPRTIEVHRARIMEKLGARNAADLVRIVLSAN
ncbi:MAG: response regulator transcription factor [Rhodobiaceae bacterium]|nr:response regulator transcription factor [Rhodobiaceae bacterium]MCC0014084.1 response regulator transcription factor [Rhodobiaceae bacterium]MCC0019382.1 response regulator transcription factor [Rhodobiaceae bacterium]MCC0051674.1 response regulator transcription factor [Rhodobiaceae bacterium]MCC0061982.1 response regulator transcription factor [Rhodobiaceae bacterium]